MVPTFLFIVCFCVSFFLSFKVRTAVLRAVLKLNLVSYLCMFSFNNRILVKHGHLYFHFKVKPMSLILLEDIVITSVLLLKYRKVLTW